jgi:serine/threonine-protein kinase
MINHILDHRYELLENIGGGGMADVYRAHDQLLDRYVAVKILHSQFSNDEEFIEKFRGEAQGAAKLSHPNIVNIYDVGKENNNHYIIMEYVAGQTLKDLIQGAGKLSVSESLRIALEIAEALEHAHANNLVHCDIKPHNILVTPTGRVKVTDFGIARAVTSSTMTYSGTIVGSVHYFSPEQAKGGAISAKSDIYSLGVVLYEMLTGQLPFTGETPISIALKHLQEEPVSVRKLNPTIPLIVEAIVLKAMEKDPNNRFANSTEMIRDIKRAESVLLHGDRQNNASSNQDPFATQILPRVSDSLPSRKNSLAPAEKMPQGNLLKSKKFLWGLICILVLGFFAGAFLSYGKFWSNAEVIVPDVVGKQMTIAKQMLETKNLRVNIAETYDADVPAGEVVSQYPAAGTTVKEQRLVTVYISKGGEGLEMPDVHGLTKVAAETKLKNMGLKLGKVEEEYSNEAAGTVLNQTPRAGTKITKGSAVDLVISKGPKSRKVTLPDFSGSTLNSIETQLKSLNLKTGTVTEVTSSKPAGTILDQTPAAGTDIAEGSSVAFSIAKTEKATDKNTNKNSGKDASKDTNKDTTKNSKQADAPKDTK